MSHTQAPLRNQHIPVSHIDAGLRVNEIFYSLQGEAKDAGRPTVFIRLTGCPLRCTYCDTTYAFEQGQRLSIEDIISHVAQYHAKYICVTGGEPLALPNCLPLLVQLCELGYQVSLETSGALDIANVDTRVSRVLDLKTPDSGEADKNLLSNLECLTPHDQIKFVICSRTDYLWAQQMLMDYQLAQKVPHIWFSPAFDIQHQASTGNALSNSIALPDLAVHLAEWILEDELPVRLQLQLHKLLWQDSKGK